MKDSICGIAMQSPAASLDAAFQRLPTSQSNEPQRVAESASARVTVDGPGPALIESDGLIAAVLGSPHWSDGQLERLRTEQGLARSLVVAYSQHGTDFLKNLRGSFSLALVDKTRNRTLLAIDRMGICQMHYVRQASGGLAFASHGGLLRSPDGSAATIRDQAVFEYLYFHMVPSPGSIYENQDKLRPGELVILQDNSLVRERYWVPTFESDGESNRTDLEGQLHGALRSAIRRMAGSGNSGCFLSGGIDSSTVAGMLTEIREHAPSFTIGFDEEGYDETSFARLTSSHFKTQQNEYFVTPDDVVDILPVIAEHYDEPFGNSSVVPTYYCAKMAREAGIDTLLAGDGGDELFGGNTRYVTQQVFDIYNRVPGFIRSSIIDPFALKLPGGDRFMPTRKLRSYVTQAKVPMPDRLETYNYFNRTAIDEILHPQFLHLIDPTTPASALRETYNNSQASTMLNRMLELDWKYTLADNDIRKVSTMCDLAGISVQYPFLDDDVVDFSTRVPSSMKVDKFRLRHFFKQSMKNYLPPQVLKKSKHGFGLPFGVWMKSYQPLRELAYDCLSDIGKRNIIQPGYLQQLIKSHNSSHAHYYGEFIWVLMMLELWLTSHNVSYECGNSQ